MHFEDKPDDIREGARSDSQNLISLFQKMQYKVEHYFDFSRADTLQQINNITQFVRNTDSLLLFFLSHGVKENSFVCRDNKEIHVDDITEKLTDSNFPAMRGKPKILFLNFCRGNYEQCNPLRYDSIGRRVQEAPRDLAIVHAALAGFKAARREQNGTIFIESLCEVIDGRSGRKELREIVYDTSQCMQVKGGTTATILPIDFRHFYFM